MHLKEVLKQFFGEKKKLRTSHKIEEVKALQLQRTTEVLIQIQNAK